MAETMEQRQKGEQFRILEPATPPAEPVAPNRIRLIAMGVLLSLRLSAGAAVLAEQLDCSFHKDVGTALYYPVPLHLQSALQYLWYRPGDFPIEVLGLLAQGYTHQRIGKQLFVSIKSVTTYRSRIAQKLGLRSRRDIICYALESGLLTPNAHSSKSNNMPLK